jgi:hypothetical protein
MAASRNVTSSDIALSRESVMIWRNIQDTTIEVDRERKSLLRKGGKRFVFLHVMNRGKRTA